MNEIQAALRHSYSRQPTLSKLGLVRHGPTAGKGHRSRTRSTFERLQLLPTGWTHKLCVKDLSRHIVYEHTVVVIGFCLRVLDVHGIAHVLGIIKRNVCRKLLS